MTKRNSLLYWRQQLKVNGYLKIFVAGPLRGKPPTLAYNNYRAAVEVADKILKAGIQRNAKAPVYSPFVPHLFMNWHIIFPHREDDWILLTQRMLKECDVVFKIEGPSEGTDAEVGQATKDGQFVFSSAMKDSLDASIHFMDANLSGHCLVHANKRGQHESLCEDKVGMLTDKYDMVNCLDCIGQMECIK